MKRHDTPKSVFIAREVLLVIGAIVGRIWPYVLDLLGGLLLSRLAASVLRPMAYAQRGYDAVGGECFLIYGAFVAGVYLTGYIIDFFLNLREPTERG